MSFDQWGYMVGPAKIRVHDGGKKITTRGLTIIKVDSERNLLVVKGSVPGKPGSLLNIRPANRVGAKPANGGK